MIKQDLIKQLGKLGVKLYLPEYTLVVGKKEYRDKEIWRVFASALKSKLKE